MARYVAGSTLIGACVERSGGVLSWFEILVVVRTYGDGMGGWNWRVWVLAFAILDPLKSLERLENQSNESYKFHSFLIEVNSQM